MNMQASSCPTKKGPRSCGKGFSEGKGPYHLKKRGASNECKRPSHIPSAIIYLQKLQHDKAKAKALSHYITFLLSHLILPCIPALIPTLPK